MKAVTNRILGAIALVLITTPQAVCAQTQNDVHYKLAIPDQAGRLWTKQEANDWYAAQPYLLGANYTTSTAINQLEMFQSDTFDPETITRELGWAKEKFGMNVMRVYVHDLLWKDDPEGLIDRFDQLLTIANNHSMRVMPVLFDSVWNPDPELGPQHRPIPGVHNSGWLQSPSRHDLIDPEKDEHFKSFVQGFIGAFATDRRIILWDLWNEPENSGGGSYKKLQLPEERARIEKLLPWVFEWAREVKPAQPLSSGVWIGKSWAPHSDSLTPIQKYQLEQSDIITFHNYGWPESFEARIEQLRPYGRPLINTEWMARGNGSTVDTILPIAAGENVGMINWGLVDGRTQTRFPWDSWKSPYILQEPSVWFHDLMHKDGTPYRNRESDIFLKVSAEKGAR